MQGKTHVENFLPAYEQLENLRSKARTFKEINGNIIFKKFNKNFSLNKVYFSYTNRKKILEDININIQKDKMTALVGKSGAGKTTIADLEYKCYYKHDEKFLSPNKS